MKTRRVAGDRIVLWLFVLPGILYFAVFRFLPVIGSVIAFLEYNIFQGIMNSPWVGLEHFARMFSHGDLLKIFRNSVRLGLANFVVGFPAPILLALLINEVKSYPFKRTVQTLVYLPHFLSWVIVGSLFLNILSVNGVINQALTTLGLQAVDFVGSPRHFVGVLVLTGTWKEVGWGTIVYLAAISGVSPSLYEAAMLDGANRYQQMGHITLPSLLPTMIMLMLLSVGHILDANVEQVLMFLNPLVMDVGEVFDTYMYRIGLVGGQYSYTTAIGLFKSVIGILLLVGLNALSRKTTGESLY